MNFFVDWDTIQKYITLDVYKYLQGHFPGDILYPGAVITELLNQINLKEVFKVNKLRLKSIPYAKFYEPLRENSVFYIEGITTDCVSTKEIVFSLCTVWSENQKKAIIKFEYYKIDL